MKINNFFTLLKSSLYTRGEDNKINEDIDWKKIYYISEKHNISPMIYESAIKIDEFKDVDNDFKKYWKNQTVKMTIDQVRRSDKFLKIYEEFNKANISVLVFKGIICRQLYPSPDQRISGDEYMLVSKDEFKKCEEIILANRLAKIPKYMMV